MLKTLKTHIHRPCHFRFFISSAAGNQLSDLTASIAGEAVTVFATFRHWVHRQTIGKP